VITLDDDGDLEKESQIAHAINLSLDEVVDGNINPGESEIIR